MPQVELSICESDRIYLLFLPEAAADAILFHLFSKQYHIIYIRTRIRHLVFITGNSHDLLIVLSRGDSCETDVFIIDNESVNCYYKKSLTLQ